MSNHSNQSGETPYVAIVIAMAAIVGILLLVQLFRGQPIDNFSTLVISVCFVVSVVVTAMWGKRSGI